MCGVFWLATLARHPQHVFYGTFCITDNETREVLLDGWDDAYTINELESSTVYDITVTAGNDFAGAGESTTLSVETDSEPGMCCNNYAADLYNVTLLYRRHFCVGLRAFSEK